PYVIPRDPKVVALDPKVYDAYVGRYEADLPDGKGKQEIVVTKERDRLMVQPKGRAKVVVVPEAENRFYVQAVDGLVEFVTTPAGGVTEMVVLQDNQKIRARRVEPQAKTDSGVRTSPKAGAEATKSSKPREVLAPAPKP